MCASRAFIGPAENGATQVSPGAESAQKSAGIRRLSPTGLPCVYQDLRGRVSHFLLLIAFPTAVMVILGLIDVL